MSVKQSCPSLITAVCLLVVVLYSSEVKKDEENIKRSAAQTVSSSLENKDVYEKSGNLWIILIKKWVISLQKGAVIKDLQRTKVCQKASQQGRIYRETDRSPSS